METQEKTRKAKRIIKGSQIEPIWEPFCKIGQFPFLPLFCILSFAIIVSCDVYMKRKLACLICLISGLGTNYAERIVVMKNYWLLFW